VRLIWPILKKTITDFWDELFYLILFNLLWLAGTALIIPFPSVTFALFFTIRDVSDSKGITLRKFLGYGKLYWKEAYSWGLVNVGVMWLLLFNLRFYAGLAGRWAVVGQVFFVALTMFWLMWQLLALALYPRLEKPGLKLALRNAAILLGKYPLVSLAMLGWLGLLGIISVFIPAIFVLAGVSLAAILATNTVAALLRRELGDPPPVD
jgi:uncharacterized membrane protein YesL